MNNLLPALSPAEQKERIVSGIKRIFQEQKIEHAVIGLSGGIDSMLSFFLLKEALASDRIFPAHLFYDTSHFERIEKVLHDAHIPQDNIHSLSIKEPVAALAKLLKITDEDKIRKGNLAARTRMIILFDLAKKYNALVCGTENKTENLLGYFTRFGDQASDIEPISTLYKTQVLELAKFMGVPDEFINQKPSAGLWAGQTDEGEFGFTYQEADRVLYLVVEKGQSIEEAEKQGFPNANAILKRRQLNLFKHNVPYIIE